MKKIQCLKFSVGIIVVVLGLFQLAPIVHAPKSTEASWTFVVYLDADNSLDSFGPINLQQLSNGMADGANVNVVVLMDRLNLPAYCYEVTHQQVKIVKSLGEVDMGNPETLTSFVTFVLNNYPATNYFLDLWDHGGGYTGVCWDESSGNHLTPHDVARAVASAESITKASVQVIGFDACLMGMTEVCYELKDVTNIVVASEMLVPGNGWPYMQLMTYLSANPTVDPSILSSELVKDYVAFYPKSKVQLSAVNESSLANLAISLNNFADALKTNVYVYKGVIAGARSDSQQKFVLGTQASLFYVDLSKFAQLIGKRTGNADIADSSQNLIDQLHFAVFAEAHTKSGNMDTKQFGLTIYFPPNINKYSTIYETDLPSFAQDTSWTQFLKLYYTAN